MLHNPKSMTKCAYLCNWYKTLYSHIPHLLEVLSKPYAILKWSIIQSQNLRSFQDLKNKVIVAYFSFV